MNEENEIIFGEEAETPMPEVSFPHPEGMTLPEGPFPFTGTAEVVGYETDGETPICRIRLHGLNFPMAEGKSMRAEMDSATNAILDRATVKPSAPVEDVMIDEEEY